MSVLCLRAAFTRLAVLVVQVGAARQAGLLYGSGRCMIRQRLEDRAMCSGKGHTTCDCPGAKSEHCTAGMVFADMTQKFDAVDSDLQCICTDLPGLGRTRTRLQVFRAIS